MAGAFFPGIEIHNFHYYTTGRLQREDRNREVKGIEKGLPSLASAKDSPPFSVPNEAFVTNCYKPHSFLWNFYTSGLC
jgi:hypothetical protein